MQTYYARVKQDTGNGPVLDIDAETSRLEGVAYTPVASVEEIMALVAEHRPGVVKVNLWKWPTTGFRTAYYTGRARMMPTLSAKALERLP